MNKTVKKLTLHRETLRALSDLHLVVGGIHTERTECSRCLTICLACNLTAGTNCC